jgi:hypothetical protein
MNCIFSDQNMIFRPQVVCFKDKNRSFVSILEIEASRQALLWLHISSSLFQILSTKRDIGIIYGHSDRTLREKDDKHFGLIEIFHRKKFTLTNERASCCKTAIFALQRNVERTNELKFLAT